MRAAPRPPLQTRSYISTLPKRNSLCTCLNHSMLLTKPLPEVRTLIFEEFARSKKVQLAA